LRVVSLPADEEQEEEHQELAVGQARRIFAGQLRVDHDREHVVARLRAVLGDQLGAVALDARVRPPHRLGGLAQLAARVLECCVHPVAQLRARLLRNAEQDADRLERELARHVDHEVAPAALDGRGEDRARATAQLRLEVGDLAAA
jgi:hypothetical protein